MLANGDLLSRVSVSLTNVLCPVAMVPGEAMDARCLHSFDKLLDGNGSRTAVQNGREKRHPITEYRMRNVRRIGLICEKNSKVKSAEDKN